MTHGAIFSRSPATWLRRIPSVTAATTTIPKPGSITYNPVTTTPEICRFINADSQLNAKDGVLGYNMFAYCINNPVMYSDPSGHSIILTCIIVGTVIGALAGGHIAAKVSKAKTGKVNGWAVAGGIVGGGIIED